MNQRRWYHSQILSTLLVMVFLLAPSIVFGATDEEIGAVESFFQRILWGILTTITGTILWICAMLFDFAVNTFVIGFGNLFLGSGIGVAVDRIWFILRDFVNMFFIFGLVYIGFKMILDADNSNTRRWLVNLIIAAILINFSLFITKAVVDFSNNIATQIAASGFPGEWVEEGSGEDAKWGRYYKVNLGDYSLGLMGVKDILNCQINAKGCGGGWGYIFGTAIFFLITAFVLAAGAFLLMIRFIALTMFILVSPLMFISWVLPPVSDTMHKYWHAFMSRAFFAPIYFLFLYFSLETLVGLQETLDISSGGGKWAKTFSTAAADGKALDAAQSTLPYFFVMCGFMIGSLIIAQKLGADGANTAMSWGHSLKNKAISYSKKGAANTGKFAARTAGGVAARGINDLSKGARSRYNNLAIRAQNSTSLRGRIANRVLRGTDGVTQRALNAGENASVYGSETRSAQTERRAGYVNRNRQAENVNNRARNATASVPPINEHSTQEEIDTRINSQRQRQGAIARMNDQELTDFIRTNQSAAEDYRVRAATGEYNEADLADMRAQFTDTSSRDFLSLLSDQQMTAYENSGMLTNPQIQEARQTRDEGALEDVSIILDNSNASTQQLNEAMDRFAQIVQGLSGDRLNDALARQFRNGEPIPPAIAANMTAAQWDTYRNSGRATREQVTQVEAARNAGLSAIAINGNLVGRWELDQAGQPTLIRNESDHATVVDPNDPNRRIVQTTLDRRRNVFQNAQEAGRMPADVLANANVAEHLTPQVIASFMQNNPSPGDVDMVRTNVENYINGNGPEAERARTAFERWQRTDLGARFGAEIY